MAGARPRWGYHQLTDWYAEKLVATAGVRAGELVVDLGAGTGAITRHLLDRGARVIAVELHPGRANQLRDRFRDERCVVLARDLGDWRPPRQPYRAVANPPFSVLSSLLRLLTAPHSQLVSADLVVPAYIAARWSRGAGHAPHRYSATVNGRLPAHAFAPPATQSIAVLRLQTHGTHTFAHGRRNLR